MRAMTPPHVTDFLTPRSSASGFGAAFASPERAGASSRAAKANSLPRAASTGGGGDPWIRDIGESAHGARRVAGGGAGGGGGGGGGGGDGAGGKGGKRAFKRMFSGVPSPSHFRRSLSFAGSISVISSAATRVAAGAMTPIRRRRHHRRDGSYGDDSMESSLRGDSRGGGGGGSRSRLGSRDSTGGRSSRGSNGFEDSPNQTGFLSPEDSPPRTRKGLAVPAAQAPGMVEAAARVKQSEKRKKTSGGEKESIFAAAKRKDGSGGGGGAAESSSAKSGSGRVFSSGGGGQSSGRRRGKASERRRQLQAAQRRSPRVSEQNSNSKGTDGLAVWSWGRATQLAEGGGGENRPQERAEPVAATGRREEDSGRPPSHDGESGRGVSIVCLMVVQL